MPDVSTRGGFFLRGVGRSIRGMLARGGCLALTTALASCSPAASPDTAAGGSGDAKVASFKVSSTAFHVDKIGGGDGSLEPDGIPDAVFDATVEGPALGLILLAKNASGAPCAQWDTLTGKDTLPTGAGLYSTHGDSTAGVVVFEGDVQKTRTDGSIPPLSAGPHTFTLYAELRDVPQMRSVELLLQRADGTLVHGLSLSLTPPAPPS